MEYKKPKVSIIIPLYNSEKYICQAIESCVNQTYKIIEIIVIDDGSTDNSKIVIEPYIKKNKIRYFYQRNKERSAARNYGLDIASGDYINFLDSDDLLDINKIEKQVNFLESNRKYFAIYSPVEYFYDDNGGFISILGKNYSSEYITDDLIFGNFVPIQSVLFRKNDIRFNENINFSEDWEYFINMFFGNKVYCSSDVLSKVRISSQVSTKYKLKMTKGELSVIFNVLNDNRFKSKRISLFIFFLKRILKLSYYFIYELYEYYYFNK